jgi:hypothetical protein
MRKQQCRMAKGGAVARVNGTESSEEASESGDRPIRESTTSRPQGTKGWTAGVPDVSADWWPLSQWAAHNAGWPWSMPMPVQPGMFAMLTAAIVCGLSSTGQAYAETASCANSKLNSIMMAAIARFGCDSFMARKC